MGMNDGLGFYGDGWWARFLGVLMIFCVHLHLYTFCSFSFMW